MVGIYKITNPKGKVYIGKSVNLHSRKNDYKRLDCKGQTLIYRSLKKYGWDTHKFEIIEECPINKLNEREIYWGLFYNTLNEGLNLRIGEGKGFLSKESKQKMSMAHKDIPLSKKHKQSISDAMKGHIKTEKWKKNLSKSSTESFGRKVLQKDLEDNLIREWNSGKQASQELNLGYTAINNCCRFNAKDNERQRDKDKVGKFTSFSYIWEYKRVL
jgi:group I intron endonuclease